LAATVGVRGGKLVDASGVDLSAYKRWRSADHERGAGRVHLLDPENAEKTVCGFPLAVIGGQQVASVAGVTCRRCPALVVSRLERDERQREWNAGVEAAQRKAEAEAAERRARYHEYLKTPEWRAKRRLVIERARGLCEGCGINAATQVHHLTYEHVGAEFLWELRAVCDGCHERAHAPGRGL